MKRLIIASLAGLILFSGLIVWPDYQARPMALVPCNQGNCIEGIVGDEQKNFGIAADCFFGYVGRL